MIKEAINVELQEEYGWAPLNPGETPDSYLGATIEVPHVTAERWRKIAHDYSEMMHEIEQAVTEQRGY
jgi:hypothetical protein